MPIDVCSAIQSRGNWYWDAFGRQRISEPETLFDSKMLYDKLPLLWDEDITDTSGNATSTHSTTNAAVTMHAEAEDTIIRQTKTWWNYQPGKSQLILLTGAIGVTGTGAQSCMGLYNDDEGLFFRNKDGVMQIVLRKGGSDTAIDQGSWNGDNVDGTSYSEVNADWDKSQILAIDMEWLGVGAVRFWLFKDGYPILLHEIRHFNLLTAAYIATPNLPVRYEVNSAAGGATHELVQICSTVISEGGIERQGILRSASTDGTLLNANATTNIYAALGVRLKSTRLSAQVRILDASLVAVSVNDDYECFWTVNPTIASGTFTWADETNSAVQVGRPSGDPGPVVTANSWDARFGGGQASSANRTSNSDSPSALFLGSTYAGVADTFVLCVRPYGVNADLYATGSWRELW